MGPDKTNFGEKFHCVDRDALVINEGFVLGQIDRISQELGIFPIKIGHIIFFDMGSHSEKEIDPDLLGLVGRNLEKLLVVEHFFFEAKHLPNLAHQLKRANILKIQLLGLVLDENIDQVGDLQETIQALLDHLLLIIENFRVVVLQF